MTLQAKACDLFYSTLAQTVMSSEHCTAGPSLLFHGGQSGKGLGCPCKQAALFQGKSKHSDLQMISGPALDHNT